jgi:hypothetical protein
MRLARCIPAAVLILAAAQAASVQPPAVSKMLNLFEELRASHRSSRHMAFSLSDSEINEYLTYALRAAPRPGIQSANVKVFPHNYISTYTVVDFDAVERWKPGTVPVLLRPVLSGRKAIWVDIRFQAYNGRAAFSVEKAYLGSLRLPAFFVQKAIQILAARQPEKYDTRKPLPLPFGLKRLSTREHWVNGEN